MLKNLRRKLKMTVREFEGMRYKNFLFIYVLPAIWLENAPPFACSSFLSLTVLTSTVLMEAA